jgi:pSer/pThr/pTyr-binding forkhead associated (FHA) protein
MSVIEIGIVCGSCATFAPLGTGACEVCKADLAMLPAASAVASAPPVAAAPAAVVPAQAASAASAAVLDRVSLPIGLAATQVDQASPVQAADTAAKPKQGPEISRHGWAGATLPHGTPEELGLVPPQPKVTAQESSKTTEELMDQAKNFVCTSCSTAVPLGHKFCGRCGAAVPTEIMTLRTQFFGQLQAPGKAKLILIRGEGVEGLSYQLNAENHVVGRSGQLVFPDDPFVSPKHANFFYRNDKLVVKDEGSLNGVYIRVRGTVDINAGDYFLAGEQVFRVEGSPSITDEAGPDGTFFYSSPKYHMPFRILQLLQGGAVGMTVCARGNSLQIGREGGELNFPGDLYMSAGHCKIEDKAGNLQLTDMGSRNGTYVRVRDERELNHGDYVFIGRKLLRVEITSN